MENIKINYDESTEQEQTYDVDIPRLKSVENILVNTGTIEITDTQKDKITIKIKGGAVHRRDQIGGTYTPAKNLWVDDYHQSYYSAYHDGRRYTGTLTKYIFSGVETQADTKTITKLQVPWEGTSVHSADDAITQAARTQPDSYSYNRDGYVGTIPRVTYEYGTSVWNPSRNIYVAIIYGVFTGQVTKPYSDTRVYRYRGIVKASAIDTRIWKNWYKYEVIIDYLLKGFEARIKLDNQLKESNQGWVKISNELKEVDSVKMLVNGELKEV